ncbi:hypothetical protein M406DRAFT_356841 [Cryphonectria parasitica EP155]|uniref:Uncharacterized protein n=1 Tax=Cryphonectria parasitica (strain ATCC 38755 / EP155) TaxID=660469 RepID=A0A9P4Y1A0_CRYP1|nr:uncharacterized protein M406DRAFT_356841 [Cryphonectria parasitica EP155]KAF3765144.1 hypothetical protein M406DRAFT_356841 [Cryphonectria parasitica EP155]
MCLYFQPSSVSTTHHPQPVPPLLCTTHDLDFSCSCRLLAARLSDLTFSLSLDPFRIPNFSSPRSRLSRITALASPLPSAIEA